MKAITVRQPWAWAIIHAGKDIENRTRNIVGDYRGPVAIHSSGRKHDDADYIAAALDHRIWTLFDDQLVANLRTGWGLLHGCILGTVNLTGVHRYPDCASPDRTHCSWWADQVDGSHHLELDDPRPLRLPVQIPGHLGLWELPGHLLTGRW